MWMAEPTLFCYPASETQVFHGIDVHIIYLQAHVLLPHSWVLQVLDCSLCNSSLFKSSLQCKSLCAGQVVCEQKLHVECPMSRVCFAFCLFLTTRGPLLSPHVLPLCQKTPCVPQWRSPCCCLQVTTCTWGWVMPPGALNTHSKNRFTSL